ncbi:hypothetical protein DINM_006205 [Dirofilaria immitis]|nr:hypothetical protein [Dirofilaria immitis]
MRNSLQSLLILLIIVSPISGQVVNSFNGNIVGNNSLNNNANTVTGGTTRVPLPGSSGSRPPLFPSPGNLPRFLSLPGSEYPQFPPLNRRFGFGGYGWAGYGGFGGYGLRRYGPKISLWKQIERVWQKSGLGGFGGPGLSGLSGFGGPGMDGTTGFSGVNGFGELGGAGLGGFPGPVGPPGADRPDRDPRRYSANIQRG